MFAEHEALMKEEVLSNAGIIHGMEETLTGRCSQQNKSKMSLYTQINQSISNRETSRRVIKGESRD